MKIHLSKLKKDKGGALLAIAIVALIVAGLLVTYLLMVSNEMSLVVRSHTWNNALGVAESGMEEGMALINENVGNPNANWITNATHDGWSTNSPSQAEMRAMTWAYNGVTTNWAATNGTIFHIRRWLDATNGYYDVYVNTSLTGTGTNGPEILSIGSANWNNTTTSATNAVRKIYVQTFLTSTLGEDGLIANQITFHGNNVTIDSFDSSSPSNSIWTNAFLYFHGARYGTYGDNLSYNTNRPPYRTANVNVAMETNYIDIGNANVYGYIDTAPGGTANVGANGSVGDLDWVHNGHSGIQPNPNHARDDMNQRFVSIAVPSTFINAYQTNNWLPVPTGNSSATIIAKIGGTWLYTNIVATNPAVWWTNIGGFAVANVNNGGWTIGGVVYPNIITNKPDQIISLAQTNTIIGGVTIYKTVATYSPYTNYYAMHLAMSGNFFIDAQYVRLYLTNGMSSPNLVLNTNADALIYSQGNISFGTTINNTALARALTIQDVPGHPISITGNGNAGGVAKIYAPSSSIQLNGGGGDTIDIIGEITCNSADFNGHFNLHFDQSLQNSTPATQFVTGLWREVQ